MMMDGLGDRPCKGNAGGADGVARILSGHRSSR
jgi:hypothetical protein